MVEDQNSKELDKLLSSLIGGRATAETIAALEAILDGNPDARRRYVHYMDLHQELLARGRDGLHQNALAKSSDPSHNGSVRASGSRTKVAVLVALAAALLVSVGLGIGRSMRMLSQNDRNEQPSVGVSDFGSTTEDVDDGVAILTHAVDAEWLGDASPLAGSILSPCELKLSRGLIQIEFYNGVQLLAEGPAELEIQSVANIVCRSGRLRSRVPVHATGFSVLTPKFELVDLGTEFALDVASDGSSDVHVFDGEVELYLPDGKRQPDHRKVLLGGDALAWSTEGTETTRAAAPETFTSFETLRIQAKTASELRFENWQRSHDTLRANPLVVARYDFQSTGTTLIDSSATKAHGTIVGCEWTSGRWPEKRALEFKRPGDRVRIDVPGEFDALTIAAWVRVDALPGRRQSLLLTDGYEVSHLHWQIGPDGELRMGSRGLSTMRHSGGFASPPVFTPRQIGVWNFVCSTYDRATRTVTHWFNGKRVFTKSLEVDQPIRIGTSEIGNWGVPLKPGRRAIRNFIGRIDELTLWNTVLQEDQIADLYLSSRP